MASSNNYETGYKKPPVHTRFAPGKSGNPKGRPKKVQATGLTDIERLLSESISVRVNGKPKTMTAFELLLRCTVDKALGGCLPSMRFVYKIRRQLMMQECQRLSSLLQQKPLGFMLLPAPVTAEEWEAIAIPSQAKLMHQTQGLK